MINSFLPIFNNESKILILGSVPSVKSLEAGFYYMHPQNRFWNTVSEICATKKPETTEDKKKMLLDNRIAIMDIIKSCERTGSLDSNIKNIEVQNLYEVINNSKISKIFCNGKKSYEITIKYYPELDITYLPSTSPANNVNFDKDKWLILRDYI